MPFDLLAFCLVRRRKTLITNKEDRPAIKWVALSLNSFGNQDIIDNQLDEAVLEFQSRKADFGGGLVPRCGLARADRMMQGRIQSNGGGRAAFSLKETHKIADKANQDERKALYPRAPVSPRWGVKGHSARPQSARDSREENQAHRRGTPGAHTIVRRRPQSARPAASMVSNRHAIGCDQGSSRARARADGNRHIRSSRHSTHTAIPNDQNAEIGESDPPSATEVAVQCNFAADELRVSANTCSKNTADQAGHGATIHKDAAPQEVPGEAATSCPFAHAWRRSRAVQLDRNHLLAERAKVVARAGPLVGRARAPPRNVDRTATQRHQPKTQTKFRPQTAAARMTTTKATSVSTTLLSDVRPSSAPVQLRERPRSAGTVRHS